MEIQATRFGAVDIDPDDVILFPTGMMGLDDCQQWVLLADSQNDALGWLQSTTHADVALAVVSPRRFVPDYDVRVPSSELAPLVLTSLEDAHVLVVVSKTDQGISLNLRAPLVINLRRRLGRQVVHNVDHAVRHELFDAAPLRKVA